MGVAWLRGKEAQNVLQDEPGHARAGLQQREDEQHLEHDDEVIQVGHHRPHAGQVGQNLRHAQRERDGAGGAACQLLLDAGFVFQLFELLRLQVPLLLRLRRGDELAHTCDSSVLILK